MADPFSDIFNPSRGGVFGTIGGLLGRPTDRGITGQGQGQAMNALSEFIQQGASPQEAVTKFLKTPQGVDFFIRDPNAGATLSTWIKNVTPPNEELVGSTAPGHGYAVRGSGGKIGPMTTQATTEQQNVNVPTVVSTPPAFGVSIKQGSNVTQQFTQPTTEIQNKDLPQFQRLGPGETAATVQGGRIVPGSTSQTPTLAEQNLRTVLSEYKNADPRVRQDITNAMMMTDAAQKNMALSRLAQDKAISPAMQDFLIADTIQLKEITKPNGEGTGLYVGVNKATGQIVGDPMATGTGPSPNMTTPPGGGAGAKGALPIPDTARDPDGTVNLSRLFQDPRDAMFFAAGVPATVTRIGGNIARWFNPSSKEELSLFISSGRNQVNALRASIAALPQIDGRLAAQQKVWESRVDEMASTGDPLASIQQGFNLANDVLRARAKALIDYQDRTQPKSVQDSAAKHIQAYDDILSQLPTPERARQIFNAIREGKVAGVSPAAAGGSLATQAVDAAKGTVEAVGSAAGAVTNTPAAAQPPASARQTPTAKPTTEDTKHIENLNKLSDEGITKMAEDGSYKNLTPAAQAVWLARAKAIAASQAKNTAKAGSAAGPSPSKRSVTVEATEE